MIMTCHWSATGPTPITDYHVEFALVRPIPSDLSAMLSAGKPLGPADVDRLKAAFDIWKFMDFSAIPQYAVWHLNHDPRDGTSADVSIAALCMGGENVTTTGSWGKYPFTWAHAYIMAAIVARIATIKNVDVGESFDESECKYSAQQNGPIYTVATHGYRAYQTPNPGVANPERGYFLYSGDNHIRWDLAALNQSVASGLRDFDSALALANKSCQWLRETAHTIKAAGVNDLWGLDKDPVEIP